MEMETVFVCSVCSGAYSDHAKMQLCEEQPVKPVLKPKTKVRYQGKICRVGTDYFLDKRHVRHYDIERSGWDNGQDGVSVDHGYVSENRFNMVKQ